MGHAAAQRGLQESLKLVPAHLDGAEPGQMAGDELGVEQSRDEFQRFLEAAVGGGGVAHGRGASASWGGSGGGGGGGAAAAAAGGAAAGAGAGGASGVADFSALPEGAGATFVLQLVSQTSNTGCSTA